MSDGKAIVVTRECIVLQGRIKECSQGEVLHKHATNVLRTVPYEVTQQKHEVGLENTALAVRNDHAVQSTEVAQRLIPQRSVLEQQEVQAPIRITAEKGAQDIANSL